MSSSFRALSRFSSSQITSQYMSRPPPPSSVSQFSRVGRNLAKSGRVLHDLANVDEDNQAQESSNTRRGRSVLAGAADGRNQSGQWPRESINRRNPERTSKGPGAVGIGGEGQKMRQSLEQALNFIEEDTIEEDPTEEALSEDEAVPEATQTKILIACLVSLVVSQSLFLSVETIIPLYVDKKYNLVGGTRTETISPTVVSFIMIASEVSSFFFSPIVPVISQAYGRKTIISVGYIMGALSLGALACTYFIDDPTTYVWVAIVCRIFQGIGDQQCQLGSYAVLASSFASKREKIFGYAETAGGVGLLIGPIAGEFVNNNLGGYLPSFLFFAGLLALSGILNLVLLPASLNGKPVVSNEEFKNLGDAAPVKVQYSWFFKNRRGLFTLGALAMLSFSVNFKQSFMTPYLEESGLVQQSNLGKVLALSALFQVLSTTVIGFVLNLAPKRTFILLAFVLLTASTLLLGPSPTLGLSSHFTPLFYIGLAVNGFASGILLPPALPEVLDSVYARQRLLEGADEVLDALVADRASGLYGVFICAGTISAPVVGSAVFSALGGAWGQTCDVFSVVGGIWTLSYAVFNVLPDVHREGAELAEMEKMVLSDPNSRVKLKSMMLKDDPSLSKRVSDYRASHMNEVRESLN